MNNKVLHYGLLNAAVNDFVIRHQRYEKLIFFNFFVEFCYLTFAGGKSFFYCLLQWHFLLSKAVWHCFGSVFFNIN